MQCYGLVSKISYSEVPHFVFVTAGYRKYKYSMRPEIPGDPPDPSISFLFLQAASGFLQRKEQKKGKKFFDRPLFEGGVLMVYINA